MITPDYIQLMAVYNHWQNDSLVAAADGLSDEERRKDRGSFFRSIHETLNHILWADQIWMHRLAGTPEPAVPSIPQSTGQYDGWDEYKTARTFFDETIMAWSHKVTLENLSGDLTWYSGAMKKDISKPKAPLIVHMFNHATHHRGQVHAMLTAAGAKPDDTDIPFMPENYQALLST